MFRLSDETSPVSCITVLVLVLLLGIVTGHKVDILSWDLALTQSVDDVTEA